MKLKAKILVVFSITMVVPILLVSLSYMIIIASKFNYNHSTSSGGLPRLKNIDSSFRYISNFTKENCIEIREILEKDPKAIQKKEVIDEIDGKLRKKYTHLLVLKGKDFVYGNNPEFYDKLKNILYTIEAKDTNLSTYYENNGIEVLIKMIVEPQVIKDGYKIFFISDVAEINRNSRKAVSELFFSLILSIFIPGVILTIWINRTLVKPINELKSMTKRIVKGDLDTEITSNHRTDEVSELCDDFNNMRVHLKHLLGENINNEKQMRDIMVNISHDIRTPLTSIKGYTLGLLEGVANTEEKQDKYLKIIKSKVDEIDTLIEELSTFAKLDMNYVPYHFTAVNVNEYLEGVVRIEKTDFELQNIKLLYTRNLSEKTVILIDQIQFNKVINNILFNAKKYRKLDVRSIVHIKTFEEGKWIRLEIEDNGKGIQKENLSRIFDRFYREDSSRNVKSGGSGLGLAIAKKIVENHNGTITAESEKGIGTKIIIRLKKYEMSKGNQEESYE